MSDAAQIKSLGEGRLVEVITRLNAARRALRLYPSGHVSIDVSIENAFAALSQLLKTNTPIILRASKKALMFAGEKLRKDHPACQELAQILHERDIAAIAFQKELTKEDLERFIELINQPPPPPGAYQPKDDRRDISHIRIRGFDYRNLKLTIESVVHPDETFPEDDDLAFLENPSPEPAMPVEPGVRRILDRWIHEDVDQLSEIVDKYRTVLESEVDDYSTRLERHFAQGITGENLGVTDERIKNLDAFSQKLSPSLSNQIRSFDFKELATNKNFIALDDILGNENSAFIFNAIQKANASDMEISPTLIGLVRKILMALKEDSGLSGPSSAIDELGKMMKDNPLERLFQREDYESYIVPEYDQLLKRLTREKKPGADQPVEFQVDGYLSTFEQPFMEDRMKWVSLKILESELLDEELYRDVMNKITDQALQMIPNGSYNLIADFVLTLERHVKEKTSASMKAAAESIIHRLRSREVVSQSLEALSQTEEMGGGKAVDFLVWQGSDVVPHAIDACIKSESPRQLVLLHEILGHYSEQAISGALSHITHSEPRTVRRMMAILGQLGDSRHASELLPFTSHPDREVRQEAVTALLQAGHPEGSRKIAQLIRSRQTDEAEYAIQTAGRFAIKECVQDLISILQSGFCIRKSSFRKNEIIIRALGQIGDPSAIGHLERIANKKWTLHREALAKLKLTLFSNLERYPKALLGKLVRIGERSADVRIKNLVMNLSNAGENDRNRNQEDSEDRTFQ